MKYGYARVSSHGQSLDEQIAKLRAAGCEIIRAEKVSGKSLESRDELETLLQFARSGDEVWITRIDRAARSLRDLLSIVERLRERGAALRATDQALGDPDTPAGAAFLSMLGVFAQFERDLILERQREGIARAKREGKMNGRPGPRVERGAVARLLAEQVRPVDIAKRLKIGRATVYRIIDELSGAAT
jgi:DNA invertase Pin-like site-specific DNA recombinase